jgi:hypothetical protein
LSFAFATSVKKDQQHFITFQLVPQQQTMQRQDLI